MAIMGSEGYVVELLRQPAAGIDVDISSDRQEGLRWKKNSYQFLKRQKY
jgi:hypothetical protein